LCFHMYFLTKSRLGTSYFRKIRANFRKGTSIQCIFSKSIVACQTISTACKASSGSIAARLFSKIIADFWVFLKLCRTAQVRFPSLPRNRITFHRFLGKSPRGRASSTTFSKNSSSAPSEKSSAPSEKIWGQLRHLVPSLVIVE